MFELNVDALIALRNLVSSLTDVPVRAQRKVIMEAADRALPKGPATNLFLAIGSGGSMSQTGAAELIIDLLFTDATFQVGSQNTLRGRAYSATIQCWDTGSQNTGHSRDQTSAGVALLCATLDLLIVMARGGTTHISGRRPRAGAPANP